ncbi:hypothetical protein TTHERM_00463490 (macronuclear) [Tetrahymena thermophila SB210]|uniref:Uncharacterized protein n=1 Tax=Tetrahymena thermophila (strain SB210) TaxID=312017 RepID=Q23PT4_TETTS|nr:hypothetical protein TTHERM_00463490 [Tetrahymena thermophila SB210]EAR98601.2 hypothetical protein TTHERM_00463490 [Tetrahymena thermophila SB210]|eukprot:XP_001018846.2 hypothetical protein TTHERM_00463490 [Tetrahymena thermophila SB210]
MNKKSKEKNMEEEDMELKDREMGQINEFCKEIKKLNVKEIHKKKSESYKKEKANSQKAIQNQIQKVYQKINISFRKHQNQKKKKSNQQCLSKEETPVEVKRTEVTPELFPAPTVVDKLLRIKLSRDTPSEIWSIPLPREISNRSQLSKTKNKVFPSSTLSSNTVSLALSTAELSELDALKTEESEDPLLETESPKLLRLMPPLPRNNDQLVMLQAKITNEKASRNQYSH